MKKSTSIRAGEDTTESTHHSLTASPAVSHAQEAQPSRLPWFFAPPYELRSADDSYVVRDGQGLSGENAAANAAFIVRATGAYYQFRAALVAIAAGTEAPADLARRALDGDRE